MTGYPMTVRDALATSIPEMHARFVAANPNRPQPVVESDLYPGTSFYLVGQNATHEFYLGVSRLGDLVRYSHERAGGDVFAPVFEVVGEFADPYLGHL